jgi:hypothetical protein
VQKTAQDGLIRGIRRWILVAITINGIIGAGIFGLPQKFTPSSAPTVSLPLSRARLSSHSSSFVSQKSEVDLMRPAVLTFMHALRLAQLSVFEIGWLMWLARLTAFAANCNLLVNYLDLLLDGCDVNLLETHHHHLSRHRPYSH